MICANRLLIQKNKLVIKDRECHIEESYIIASTSAFDSSSRRHISTELENRRVAAIDKGVSLLGKDSGRRECLNFKEEKTCCLVHQRWPFYLIVDEQNTDYRHLRHGVEQFFLCCPRR